MGCAASKLDIEADRSILSGLRPINIKKYRRRRMQRLSTFSTTTDLIQSDESETAGDASPSGKLKASAVDPEPIAEEQTENSEREELTMTDDLEMKTAPEEYPKEKMEREVPKEILKERKQKWVEITKNGAHFKEAIEGRNQRAVIKNIKENKEEPEEDIQVKNPRKTDELENDREEPKEEKEESIQCKKEELMKNKEKNQQIRESLEVKEEEVSKQLITTEEAKESKGEVERKNKEPMEKNDARDGPDLVSKRIGELEEEFPGSPSFRFYCQNIQSFDSDDSTTASGLRPTERLEEIKQHSEPIEEVSESQTSASVSVSASSQGSQCYSPRKRKGRRLLKLKAPTAVRSLFTCYNASNGCGRSHSSGHYKNHLMGKKQ